MADAARIAGRPSFEPSGQTVMPEAKRHACICRSDTGVRGRGRAAVDRDLELIMPVPYGSMMAGGGAPFAQGMRKTRQRNWQIGIAVT